MLNLAEPPVGNRRSRRQQGATLIEILVTVVLLSFGVLALAGMQAFAIAASKGAVNRGLAAALAADYADMMRANPVGFAAGNYDAAPSFDPADSSVPTEVTSSDRCDYPSCTAASLATYDKAMMKIRLKSTLKSAAIAVVRPTTGGVTATDRADLWIMWLESRGTATDADESAFDNCPAAVTSLAVVPRCLYMRVNL